MLGNYRLYRFPANSRAKKTSLAEQIDYAGGEVTEAIDALVYEGSNMRVIEELWDTIHAAEGALRKFKPQQVHDGYLMVMAKNNERGDFSTEAMQRDDWGMA